MKIKLHIQYLILRFEELIFASFIGLVIGLAAAILDFLIVFFHKLSTNLHIQILHFLILVVYVSISAYMEKSFAIPGLLLSLKYLKENKLVPYLLFVFKYIGVALTLSVVPVGREGPAMFLGTALGQYVAQILKVVEKKWYFWGTIGAAAFVGAFLKTPLGATFYVFENRFGKVLNLDFIIDALVASTISYTIYAYIRGFHPLFEIKGNFNWNIYDLIPAFALGVLAGFLTILLNSLFSLFKKFASWVPEEFRPATVLPLILLLLVISLEHNVFNLLSLPVNYEPIKLLSEHIAPIENILVAVILEILFLVILLNFGYPCGIVLPLIFLGVSLGNIVAHLDPAKLQVFALTGGAAMLSAALNLPITALIMITEMSHQTLLVPEIVGVLTAYFLTISVKVLRNE
jgi:CIC family chloride channel protein